MLWRSKLLLLLAWEGSLAAGRDAGGVVLRTALTAQDSAVPPWAVRAHRDLQASSDA